MNSPFLVYCSRVMTWRNRETVINLNHQSFSLKLKSSFVNFLLPEVYFEPVATLQLRIVIPTMNDFLKHIQMSKHKMISKCKYPDYHIHRLDHFERYISLLMPSEHLWTGRTRLFKDGKKSGGTTPSVRGNDKDQSRRTTKLTNRFYRRNTAPL